ncbi:hypothetical protein GQ607_000330 [Colletotrichum asianum]|uniref:Uncharacterized protein n=1 Tax=Colletotrichum asianum TaxID=702518 RepID=A0A8H3WSF9_9PEZI|nr:hypothetical protein GQ607_000330 [Colletotrichum asianum]
MRSLLADGQAWRSEAGCANEWTRLIVSSVSSALFLFAPSLRPHVCWRLPQYFCFIYAAVPGEISSFFPLQAQRNATEKKAVNPDGGSVENRA